MRKYLVDLHKALRMLAIDLLVDVKDLMGDVLHLVWDQLNDQDQQGDEGETKDGEVFKKVTKVVKRIGGSCLVGAYVSQGRPAEDHWSDGEADYWFFGVLDNIVDRCILASGFVVLKVSLHLRSQDGLDVPAGYGRVELDELGYIQARVDLTILLRIRVQLVQDGGLRV